MTITFTPLGFDKLLREVKYLRKKVYMLKNQNAELSLAQTVPAISSPRPLCPSSSLVPIARPNRPVKARQPTPRSRRINIWFSGDDASFGSGRANKYKTFTKRTV